MSDHSKIEWTDTTLNVVTGCTRVSPGCDHCYIERTMPFRVARRRFDKPGVGGTTGVQLQPDRLTQPLRWRKPRRIFINSLADLFHDDVRAEYIAKTFAVMALTQRHTFQVLTKRPTRMRSLLSSPDFRALVAEYATDMLGSRSWKRWQLDLGGQRLAGDSGRGAGWTVTPTDDGNLWTPPWPLPNAWLGVSVENQQWADVRIPVLLDTPASVRWLSCEPLLEPVDLSAWLGPVDWPPCWDDHAPSSECARCIQPEWVVVGGETGPGARPSHPDWMRSLRDQCQAAKVPYFFKQHGDWVSPEFIDTAGEDDVARDENGLTIWPDGRTMAGAHGTAVDGSEVLWRVGKKRAGRVLDGRTWDEFPRPGGGMR